LQARIQAAEQATVENEVLTLTVAANYGGQWDVVQAVQRWHRCHPSEPLVRLTQEQLAKHLCTAAMPDPDLLIRTGGEQRISNFLLWQCAYTELYFTDVLWPDFDEVQLTKALSWYSDRTRRFGLTTEQVQCKVEVR
jgi:undecaprenyl diphosphate synthase